MTPPHRGDDFSGVTPGGLLLLTAGLLALLPLKIVLAALSVVVIVIGFQLIIGVTGLIVVFVVFGTFLSMPFMFLYFRWDERGGWAETAVRNMVKKNGVTRDEAITNLRAQYTARNIPINPEVEALR